jgi:hypothetical protein
MLVSLPITLATSRRTCSFSDPADAVGIRRSGRQIEPGALCAVLDLDDPKVRIERNFPFEALFRRARIDAVPVMRPGENPLDPWPQLGSHGLGRRRVQRRAAVQVINFHENGASFCRATAAEDRACPFNSASTQIGGDPYVGAQSQWI